MYTYNIATDSFVNIGNTPACRYNHSASVLGTKIIFHGGAATLNGTAVDTTYIYDTVLDTYTLFSLANYVIADHASVIYNNELYIIGGRGVGTTASVSKIYIG